MIDEITIHDNDFLRQFETKLEGYLAKIEYAIQERKIFLTKLVIPEEIDSPEFEEDFIRAVLNLLEGTNKSVVPTSPNIAKFLRKHKQYKDLLPVGVRI